MTDFTAAANEVFLILRSFDYTVMLYDDEGQRVDDPADARRFFARPENILISIIEDGDNSTVRLTVGKSTKVEALFGLMRSLRTAATKFNLLFTVRRFGREIGPKDVSAGLNESAAERLSRRIIERAAGALRGPTSAESH